MHQAPNYPPQYPPHFHAFATTYKTLLPKINTNSTQIQPQSLNPMFPTLSNSTSYPPQVLLLYILPAMTLRLIPLHLFLLIFIPNITPRQLLLTNVNPKTPLKTRPPSVLPHRFRTNYLFFTILLSWLVHYPMNSDYTKELSQHVTSVIHYKFILILQLVTLCSNKLKSFYYAVPKVLLLLYISSRDVSPRGASVSL